MAEERRKPITEGQPRTILSPNLADLPYSSAGHLDPARDVLNLKKKLPHVSLVPNREALISSKGDLGTATMPLSPSASKEQGEGPKHPKRSLESDRQTPAKRIAPDLSSPHNEFIRIYVGEGKNAESFTVHKAFIFHHSPFFEKAFNDEDSLFVHDAIPSMVYNDTTPAAFGLFIRFIYRGTIKDNNNKPPPVEDMVRLWVLAGKISTAELQNVAIRGIGEMRCNVSSSSFSYIYNNTVPDSPLRRLLVDQLIGGLSIEQFGKLFRHHMDKIPKEMLADIALAQKKLSGSRVQRCEWENYYVRSSDKKPDAI